MCESAPKPSSGARSRALARAWILVYMKNRQRKFSAVTTPNATRSSCRYIATSILKNLIVSMPSGAMNILGLILGISGISGSAMVSVVCARREAGPSAWRWMIARAWCSKN